MKLKQITYKNFKGDSDTLEMGRIVVLQGSNGSGKTRILQALQLAMTGAVSHPIEPRNIDLIELFSAGDEDRKVMQVGVAFEGTATEKLPIERITRTYQMTMKNGKPSVAQTIEIEPVGPSLTVLEQERYIAAALKVFPAMVDVHKFVRLSSTERANLILQFAAPDGRAFSSISMTARLKKVLKDHPQEPPGGGADTGMGLLEILFKTEATPAAKIAEAIKGLKTWTANARKAHTESQAAARGAVELKVGTVNHRTLEEVKIEQDRVQAERTALMGSIAQANADQSRIEANRRGIEALKAVLEKLSGRDLDAEEQAALDAIDGFKFEYTARNISILNPAAERMERIKDHIRDLGVTIRAKEMAIAGLKANEAMLHGDTCPLCKGPAAGGKDYYRKEISEHQEHLDAAKANTLDLEADYGELDKVWQKRKAEIEQGLLEIPEIQKQIEHQQARLADVREMKKDRGRYAAELARLEALPEERTEQINVRLAAERLEGLNATVAQLDQEARDRSAYDTKLRMAKEATLRSKMAKAAYEAYQAMAEEADKIKMEMVDLTLKEVEGEVQGLLNLAKRRPTFVFRTTDQRGASDFSMGWQTKNELTDELAVVDFDSLSTAQQIWTLAAVLSSIIKRSGARPAVLLLDNTEVIQQGDRDYFLTLLGEATKRGYLDAAIIASSSKYPEVAIDGAHYINTGRPQ